MFKKNSSLWTLSHQLPVTEKTAFCRNRISCKTCVAKEILIIWIVCFHCYNVIWNRSEENGCFSKVVLIVLFLTFDRRYHNDEKYWDSCFNPVSLFQLIAPKFYMKFLHNSPGKKFIALTASCVTCDVFVWFCLEDTHFSGNKTVKVYISSELQLSHFHVFRNSTFYSSFTKTPRAPPE